MLHYNMCDKDASFPTRTFCMRESGDMMYSLYCIVLRLGIGCLIYKFNVERGCGGVWLNTKDDFGSLDLPFKWTSHTSFKDFKIQRSRFHRTLSGEREEKSCFSS